MPETAAANLAGEQAGEQVLRGAATLRAPHCADGRAVRMDTGLTSLHRVPEFLRHDALRLIGIGVQWFRILDGGSLGTVCGATVPTCAAPNNAPHIAGIIQNAGATFRVAVNRG